MRRINPNPELVLPGKWKKNEQRNGGSVEITQKIYSAPFDDSPVSVAIRNHEYGHLKVSPPRELWPLSDNDKYDTRLNDILGAMEDHRTNYLLIHEYDISVRAAGTLENIGAACNNMQNRPPLFTAGMYASSRFYDLHPDIEKAMAVILEKYLPEIDAILEDLKKFPTMEMTIECSRRLIEIFDKEAKQQAAQQRSDKKKRDKEAQSKPAPKSAKEREKQNQQAAEDSLIPKNDKEVTQREEEVYANSPLASSSLLDTVKHDVMCAQEQNRPFGPCTIEMAPNMKNAGLYRGIKLKPRKKPSGFGATFRYAHRVLTDKACFALPRKDSLGTILIDNSGSMSLSEEQILSILKYSSGAIIATYCGKREDGKVVILAKGGRVVKGLPEKYGGNNIVDGPALEWLRKQPAPRWWISDGWVTGLRGSQCEDLVKECEILKKKGNIKQIMTPEEFVDLMQKNKLRTYKDKYKPRL